MAKKNSRYIDALRRLRDEKKRLSGAVGKLLAPVGKNISEIDEKFELQRRFDATAERVSGAARDIGFSELANKSRKEVLAAKTSLDGHVKDVDAKFRLRERVAHGGVAVSRSVGGPVDRFLEAHGINEALSTAGAHVERAYGLTRTSLKPYFEPSDVKELLANTRSELVYITSCVLQISPKRADNWLGEFGKLLTAKVSGVLGTGTLLGLVSTFGTAGTGTAIAGLSGAASANATLAWVGSLLGGGMATGAILTAGVGVVVGVGAYKLLGSTARSFDELQTVDKGIVETAGALVAAIDQILAQDPVDLTPVEAELFLQQTLVPFQHALVDNADDVCSRLDRKNTVAYRQHVLRDFEPVVIDGFRHLIGRPQLDMEAVIGGVFYALLSRTALDGSPEQEMVLSALRRSKNDLAGASEAELSDYLDGQSPEQLQGVASNVKGIYHELWWAADYNARHDDTLARVMDETNHPGYDVEIVDNQTGEVVTSYQLKASDSSSYVREHQARYSDIDVLATDELATALDGIESSGVSNLDLTRSTQQTIDALADNTLTDQVSEAAGLVGLAAAGREAIGLLQGRSDLSIASKSTLESVVQAAAATGITAYLFS